MICYCLLVVCALQRSTWARTLGMEDVGKLGTGLVHDKVLLLSEMDKFKSSLVQNGPVEKRGSENETSVAELLVEGISHLLRLNVTGDLNGGIDHKSVITTTKEFANDLQEWIKDGEEGRHFKRHKMMARMALWLKTLLLGVVLPGAVAVALFAAWKGITLSLMALLLAGIVGLKGLVTSDFESKMVLALLVFIVLVGMVGMEAFYNFISVEDHPYEDECLIERFGTKAEGAPGPSLLESNTILIEKVEDMEREDELLIRYVNY